MKRQNFIILATIFLILIGSFFVIVVARGYQFDIKSAKVLATGILVATSDPDGAEVLINNKLITATNNTINLAPGKYLVKIKKEGLNSWEKLITIKAEEVFKTNVILFPSLPNLRPLTLTGASNPLLSPDSTKIAYTIASASAEKNGLWIMDMSKNTLSSSLFSSGDFRQIARFKGQTTWSPDSKQLIVVSSPSAYLLEADRINELASLTKQELALTISKWDTLEKTIYKTQTDKLPVKLFSLLATTSAKLQFSPDENKILYQATASASLPAILTTYLPGTNPTTENRQLTPGKLYVYDTKEDKNYLINEKVVWLPTSRHLLSLTNNQISIMDYDGSNKSIIYAGPFTNGFVFPWPNGDRLVILTNLNSPDNSVQNLYSINLR